MCIDISIRRWNEIEEQGDWWPIIAFSAIRDGDVKLLRNERTLWQCHQVASSCRDVNEWCAGVKLIVKMLRYKSKLSL